MNYKLITNYEDFKVNYVYLVLNKKTGNFNELPICVTSLSDNRFVAKTIGSNFNAWSADLRTIITKYNYSYYAITDIKNFKREFPEYFL